MPRLATLTARPDFQRNPARAIAKRFWWRARWIANHNLWPVQLEGGGVMMGIRSGSVALAYYQGASEPETAKLLHDLLQPGFVFVDAGAHCGEYTVRAARRLGPSGEIYAFEASPRTCDALRATVAANPEAAEITTVTQSALYRENGSLRFQLSPKAAESHIANGDGKTIDVPGVRLDTCFASATRQIDLIKLDVEGAELDVFEGSTGLSRKPAWLFEFDRDNYLRQGHDPDAALHRIREIGYRIEKTGTPNLLAIPL